MPSYITAEVWWCTPAPAWCWDRPLAPPDVRPPFDVRSKGEETDDTDGGGEESMEWIDSRDRRRSLPVDDAIGPVIILLPLALFVALP